MEPSDSQDNSSGKRWIEFMFIFSVILTVIGLDLSIRTASSDHGSFPLLSAEDLIGELMVVIGGVMFLFTGFLLLLKRS